MWEKFTQLIMCSIRHDIEKSPRNCININSKDKDATDLLIWFDRQVVMPGGHTNNHSDTMDHTVLKWNQHHLRLKTKYFENKFLWCRVY